MALKLMQEPPGLSPARQRLAEEIQTRNEFETDYQKLHDAASWSGRATQAVFAAQEQVERTREAIEAAKVASVEALISGTEDAGDGIRAARRDHQDAVDRLQAAESARDFLKGALAEAEARRPTVGHRAREAALSVLREEADIAGLLERMENLQREMVRVGTAMTWLHGADIIKRDTDTMGRAQMCVDPAMQIAINRFNSPPNTWNELHKDPGLRSDILWAEALTSLEADASAPLPT